MEVMNCRVCKRLFNYLSGPRICPVCREAQEKKFMEVKDFIRNNPSKNISQVSQEMDVSIQQLKQWVREERLIFSEDSGMMIECEKCGANIRTGRYCEQCKKNLVNTLEGLYQKEEPKMKRQHVNDRMHHLSD